MPAVGLGLEAQAARLTHLLFTIENGIRNQFDIRKIRLTLEEKMK